MKSIVEDVVEAIETAVDTVTDAVIDFKENVEQLVWPNEIGEQSLFENANKWQ